MFLEAFSRWLVTTSDSPALELVAFCTPININAPERHSLDIPEDNPSGIWVSVEQLRGMVSTHRSESATIDLAL
jgi:hypothetical protein